MLDQMNESLKRLKKDCVDLFYLHFPDRSVPIEETLKDVNLLYKGNIYSSYGACTPLVYKNTVTVGTRR